MAYTTLMVVLGLLLIAVILASVLLSAYAGAIERFPVLGQWIGPAISTIRPRTPTTRP